MSVPSSPISASANSASLPFIGGYMGMDFRRERFEYGTVIGCVVPYAVGCGDRLKVKSYIMPAQLCLWKYEARKLPSDVQAQCEVSQSNHVLERRGRKVALLIAVASPKTRETFLAQSMKSFTFARPNPSTSSHQHSLDYIQNARPHETHRKIRRGDREMLSRGWSMRCSRWRLKLIIA